MEDQRFKVIHQTNMGLSGARNTGISFAVGEYLVFVDSDDYVDTTLLENLYDKIHETKYSDVILYGYTSVFKDKKKVFIPKKCSLDEIKYKVVINEWQSFAWNKCFS